MKSSSTTCVKPQANDILPGPGCSRNPGNKLYVSLIDGNKKTFVLADARGKDQIVLKIYNKIQGKFLEKGKDGLYFVKDKSSALRKIKKALSENNKLMIENLQKTGQMKGGSSQAKKGSSKTSTSNKSKPKPTKEDWVKLCQTIKAI